MRDGSWVRAAHPGDAAALGALQVRAWFANHAAALGAQAPLLDPTAIGARWAEAITASPSPRHHVLVADSDGTVVGFAALAPLAGDPAQPAPAPEPGRPVTEILALEVDPGHSREGHGSRLLAACADIAREEGATSVLTWVLEDDGARAGFLTGAGFSRSSTSRRLDVGGRSVREDAWSALL